MNEMSTQEKRFIRREIINRLLQALDKRIRENKVPKNSVWLEIITLIATVRLTETFHFETNLNIYEKDK